MSEESNKYVPPFHQRFNIKVGDKLWRITREQLEEFITFDLDDLLRK